MRFYNKEHLGNAKFSFSNEGDTAILNIEGTIGFDLMKWFEDEEQNTKEIIGSKIREITASKIIVNINSYGGDVNDGISIHDMLAEHPAHVTTVVRGLSASAATIIAQAGDVRKMSDNARYLVHRGMIGFCGYANRNTLNEMIRDLESIDELISNIYAKRSSLNKEDFDALMEESNGTGVWLSAKETKEKGLIDEIFEPTEKPEKIDNKILNQIGLPPINGEEFTIKIDTDSIAQEIIGKVKNGLEGQEIADDATAARMREIEILKTKTGLK